MDGRGPSRQNERFGTGAAHRNQGSRAARRVALGPISQPDHRRARHHLDFGRFRGHLRGTDLRRLEAGSPFLRLAGWTGVELLSRGRGARRPRFRLGDRSAGPQSLVLHHARGLSRGHRRHGLFLGYRELLRLPLSHGSGNRRRIFRPIPFTFPSTPARRRRNGPWRTGSNWRG